MKKNYFFAFLFSITSSMILAQGWTETFQVLPDTIWSNERHYFGNRIDISEGIAVIGSRGYQDSRGCAYVLEHDGMKWNIIARLLASDGRKSDLFGASVAIDGNTIVVGATFKDIDYSNSGAAYLFVKPESGWQGDLTETAILKPEIPQARNYFGNNVAIDGDTVVVGAYGYQIGEIASAGAAYVYVKPESGWTELNETAILIPSDPKYQGYLGTSLDISGGVIVAGARGHDGNSLNSGAAYVFEKPISGWESSTETVKISASDANTGDQFAGSVAIENNTLVIGSQLNDGGFGNQGAVYVFENPGTGWSDYAQVAKLQSPLPTTNGYFGGQVSVSNGVIAVGARKEIKDNLVKGVAYIFEKPASGWSNTSESVRIYGSDSDSQDSFGSSIAIDNDWVLTGSPNEKAPHEYSGAVYGFKKSANGWASQAESDKITPPIDYVRAEDYQTGYAVAIWGEYAVVGVQGYNRGKGYAHVLQRKDGAWEQIASLKPDDEIAYSCFGSAVAIANDHIVVGAIDANGMVDGSGAVYLFAKPHTGWKNMTQTAKLISSNGAISDQFGYSVAIYGNTVVVGAPKADTGAYDAGAAYVFEMPNAGWTDMIETAILVGAKQQSNYFGSSVSVSGNQIIVGAPQEANHGAAYLFVKPSTGWGSPLQANKLTLSDKAINDQFGISVSLSGELALIGANRKDNGGKAYLFEKPANGWEDMNESFVLSMTGLKSYAEFGISVCLDNNVAVVGASGSDLGNQGAGDVFVYEKPASGWADMNAGLVLPASNSKNGDYFGYSVAVSERSIIAGAPFNDLMEVSCGMAYIYDYNYTLTLSAGNNGSLQGDASQLVAHGANSMPVEALADDGFEFVEWQNSKGEAVSTNNPVVVENVIGDTSLTAIFQERSNSLDPKAMLQVKVYPNPASGKLYVESAEPAKVEILSLEGKLLVEQQQVPAASSTPIDIQNLQQGIYVLKIQSGSATAIRQLVVY